MFYQNVLKISITNNPLAEKTGKKEESEITWHESKSAPVGIIN